MSLQARLASLYRNRYLFIAVRIETPSEVGGARARRYPGAGMGVLAARAAKRRVRRVVYIFGENAGDRLEMGTW